MMIKTSVVENFGASPPSYGVPFDAAHPPCRAHGNGCKRVISKGDGQGHPLDWRKRGVGQSGRPACRKRAAKVQRLQDAEQSRIAKKVPCTPALVCGRVAWSLLSHSCIPAEFSFPFCHQLACLPSREGEYAMHRRDLRLSSGAVRRVCRCTPRPFFESCFSVTTEWLVYMEQPRPWVRERRACVDVALSLRAIEAAVQEGYYSFFINHKTTGIRYKVQTSSIAFVAGTGVRGTGASKFLSGWPCICIMQALHHLVFFATRPCFGSHELLPSSAAAWGICSSSCSLSWFLLVCRFRLMSVLPLSPYRCE